MSEFRSRKRGAVADGVSLRQLGNLHKLVDFGETGIVRDSLIFNYFLSLKRRDEH